MLNITGAVYNVSPIKIGGAESKTLSSLLKIGEQLQGEVVEAQTPQQLLVRIKGVQVHAQSSTPLPPGKTFVFEVARLLPQVELKLLPPDLMTVSGRGQYLESLNLPAESPVMNALNVLIEAGIIPGKDQISDLIGMFNNLSSALRNPHAQSEIFRALNILKTFNLPATEKTFSAALGLLHHNVNLGEAMANLERLLLQTLQKKELEGGGKDSMKEVISKLQQQISALFGKTEGIAPKGGIHQILTMIGIFYERSVRALLHQAAQGAGEADIQNLKGLILQLQKQLNERQLNEKDESFEILKQQLENTLDQIEHAQFFYSQESTVNQNIIAYIPIPVLVDGKPKTVHALFQRRSGTKKKLEHWRAHVSMELDQIGLLYMSLSGLKNYLSMRFISENKNFVNFMQNETKVLPELVLPLGYNLRNVSVEFVQSSANVWHSLLFESMFETKKAVDIKA